MTICINHHSLPYIAFTQNNPQERAAPGGQQDVLGTAREHRQLRAAPHPLPQLQPEGHSPAQIPCPLPEVSEGLARPGGLELCACLYYRVGHAEG